MAASNVDEVLCLLLDHSNRDVVHSVCGVLMNLTADPAHRRLLVRSPRASATSFALGGTCPDTEEVGNAAHAPGMRSKAFQHCIEEFESGRFSDTEEGRHVYYVRLRTTGCFAWWTCWIVR
jgi:hypothetical protein